MRNYNWKQRRKKNLYDNSPLCHWCGRETILTFEHDPHPPENLATLDHLRTRMDPHRIVPNHNMEERTVLACHRCNFIRGKVSEAESRGLYHSRWHKEYEEIVNGRQV